MLHFEQLSPCATADEVCEYLERFELFFKATKETDPEIKSAIFLHSVGKDMYSVIRALAVPNSPSSLTFDKIKELLVQHFAPVQFEQAEKCVFRRMKRNSDQSVNEFIVDLQRQALKCNLGSELDSQLRDGLIAGINDTELELKLIRAMPKTF